VPGEDAQMILSSRSVTCPSKALYISLGESFGLVCGGCSALDGGHHDALFINEQVIENPVVANTPAPSWRLQTFNVAAERVALKCL
jgi:hypothetical protein